MTTPRQTPSGGRFTRQRPKSGEKKLSAEAVSCLAMINGERKLLRDDILYTNLCMSQPALREKMAQAVVHEIESKPQLTMFGCTVADLSNNHCECEECQKKIPGESYVFEYHYYIHQYRDPGMLTIARRVYEDVRSYKFTGMSGCMEDGSNKSFWPNGFHTHIYHEAMVNRDCDYEAELADFFASTYGENWQAARDYLQEISDAFDHKYMCGEKYVDWKMGVYYNPDHAGSLAKVLSIKCQGDTPAALEAYEAFLADFGKHDVALERWLDFGAAAGTYKRLLKTEKPVVEF